MTILIPLHGLEIVYECNTETCGTDYYNQPLADVTEVGTLICPECAEDMIPVGAEVVGEKYPERTIDGETVNAVSPEPGKVLLVVEATAVGFGTHIACFRQKGTGFSDSLIEIPRRLDTVAVIR